MVIGHTIPRMDSTAKGKHLLGAYFFLGGVFLVAGLSVYPLHYSFSESVVLVAVVLGFILVEFVLDDASI